MAFSFLYLAVRALPGAIVRSRHSLDVKVLVLRHELAILRRQAARPKLEMADQALLAAAPAHLPRPQRTVLLVTPPRFCAGTRRWCGGSGGSRQVG
jgi:putative transposase